MKHLFGLTDTQYQQLSLWSSTWVPLGADSKISPNVGTVSIGVDVNTGTGKLLADMGKRDLLPNAIYQVIFGYVICKISIVKVQF